MSTGECIISFSLLLQTSVECSAPGLNQALLTKSVKQSVSLAFHVIDVSHSKDMTRVRIGSNAVDFIHARVLSDSHHEQFNVVISAVLGFW